MTTAPNQSTHIPQGIRCSSCRYDLHTLRPNEKCPECGRPIFPKCPECNHEFDAQSIHDRCPSCDTEVLSLLNHVSIDTAPSNALNTCRTGIKLILISIVLVNLYMFKIAFSFDRFDDLILFDQTEPFIFASTVFLYLVGWFKMLSINQFAIQSNPGNTIHVYSIRISLVLLVTLLVGRPFVYVAYRGISSGPVSDAVIVDIWILVLFFGSLFVKNAWIYLAFHRSMLTRMRTALKLLIPSPLIYLLLCAGDELVGYTIHAIFIIYVFLIFVLLDDHIKSILGSKSPVPT